MNPEIAGSAGLQPTRGTRASDTGILDRILGKPNGRPPEVKLEVFIRASARCDNGTLSIYLREARRFAGWLGSRPLDMETVQEYEAWLKAKFKPNS